MCFGLQHLGWNAHNGLMGGVVLHNLMLPPRDFTYQWTPLFSTSAEGVDFGGILRLDWRKKDWHVGIRSTQFRAEEALQMRPEVTIGNYDGELVDAHVVGGGAHAECESGVGLEGLRAVRRRPTCLASWTRRLDAVYTLFPIRAACGLQRRASRLEGRARDKPRPAIPGLRQTGSRSCWAGGHRRLRQHPVDAAMSLWRTPRKSGTVRGRVVAPRIHPAAGRSIPSLVHRCPGLACRVSVERFNTGLWSSDRGHWSTGLWHGGGRHGRPIRPVGGPVVVEPRRHAEVWTVDGPDAKRPSTAVGLPLNMVAPTGLWSVRGGSVTASAWKSLQEQPAHGTTAVDNVGGASLRWRSTRWPGCPCRWGRLKFKFPCGWPILQKARSLGTVGCSNWTCAHSTH